jgi:hypothetical protein
VTPFDACPECGADRACPAGIWPHAIAVALTGGQRNLNPKTARVCLGSTGCLAEHAAARPRSGRAPQAGTVLGCEAPRGPAGGPRPARAAVGVLARVTAVSAIGYDSQGCLVGAVEVSDGEFSEAHLAQTTPKAGSACGVS